MCSKPIKNYNLGCFPKKQMRLNVIEQNWCVFYQILDSKKLYFFIIIADTICSYAYVSSIKLIELFFAISIIFSHINGSFDIYRFSYVEYIHTNKYVNRINYNVIYENTKMKAFCSNLIIFKLLFSRRYVLLLSKWSKIMPYKNDSNSFFCKNFQ